MRKTTRAGLMGTAGIGAVALAVAGFSIPANADDHTSAAEDTHTSAHALDSLDAFQGWAWVDDALDANDNTIGSVGVGGGLIDGPLVRDVANGPILSGNDAPVLSGNDVSAPIGSGNDVSVDAPVGSGNEVAGGNFVGNGTNVGSGNDTGVAVGEVGAEIGDLTSDIGTHVDDLVGDVSSDVDDLVGDLLG
ncbi:hypothetical protein ACLBXX_17755 [Microbacterium sp. C23T]